MPTELKGREAVARAIYEALGYEYAGKLIDIKGQPMGAWRDALSAADAAILAYEAAKPKEAEGLKFGSRLTVEGVEAVVVSMATIEAHEKLIAELRSSIDALLDDRERRAMLSAAGER